MARKCPGRTGKRKSPIAGTPAPSVAVLSPVSSSIQTPPSGGSSSSSVAFKLYEKMKLSPITWGFFYFPIHFRSKSPAFHFDIVEAAMCNKYLAIAAPRGSSKTTLLMFLMPIHYICFKKKRCIVMVGNTFKKSASALETIKQEFRSNELLKKDFPITIKKDAEGDSTFLHSDGFEVHVICKGAEQLGSIRGEKFGAYRPDLILIDDLEDDEMVKSPQRREDLRNDFDNALMPCVDIMADFNVIALGTILHDDALIARLVSPDHYNEYEKMRYQARYIDKDEPTGLWSLWDEKWSLEWLAEQEKRNPTTFAREYMNDPVSGKEARFTKDQFRYWSVENNQALLFDKSSNVISRYALSECKGAIACDLAWSEKRDADSTVILPAFVTPSGDILIDKYIAERGMRPDKFCEALFGMELRLKALTKSQIVIGFEKAMLEKVTQWVLKSEMRKRNHWLITKELKWETDKITRIETVLQPRYAQNVIFHRQGMGDLEYQLERFPSGTHDDIIDCCQAVCRLLEYPKNKVMTPKYDNEFNWWRNETIKMKQPVAKTRFIFGHKTRNLFEIPHSKAYR